MDKLDKSHLVATQEIAGSSPALCYWVGSSNWQSGGLQNRRLQVRVLSGLFICSFIFGVFCPDNEKAYLVPVGDAGRDSINLRVDKASCNSIDHIKWAADYEI